MTALRRALADTGIRPWPVIRAVAAGTLALGASVGLAAVAAWLIARAAQMPSPADVALAAVFVRFFGITRGAARYLERLASHDVALRGVVTLRERTYDRLAHSGGRTVLALRRGDISARAGQDLDDIGDAVVRAIIPVGVAITVSAAAVAIVMSQLPLAGAALAAALVGALVAPALFTARASRISGKELVAANARVSAAVLTSIEFASEHRVWDDSAAAERDLAEANLEAEAAQERAARPAALAASSHTLFAGLGFVAALVLAVAAATRGDISGPAAAVVALTPLAAFEAASAIPAAVAQYFRSSAAAARVSDIVGPSQAQRVRHTQTTAAVASLPTLEVMNARAAWPGNSPTPPVNATLPAGTCLAVVGASGVGKTTLLLTMAGVLEPADGSITLDGRPVSADDLGATISITLEDAHLFGTSILENLRVARGSVTEDEAWAALDAVGISAWVRTLERGLHTEIGAGGDTVSGGERRRLLLARALVSTAPIVLLDEPGEHLDDLGIAALGAFVDALRAERRSVVLVTHDDAVKEFADAVVSLDG